MYRAGVFSEDGHAPLAALVGSYPLASLVVHDEGRLLTAHAPLMAECDGEGSIVALVGHLARANPFWSVLRPDMEVLAIFTGPDAYISPSMYPSKKVHGRVVPTWNYVRVEARGRAEVEADPAQVRPYFEALNQAHERGRDTPWGVDDAPEDYIGKLEHAIVGLRITLNDICGTMKLSQNRNQDDLHGVRDALANSPYLSDQAVGTLMAPYARLD